MGRTVEHRLELGGFETRCLEVQGEGMPLVLLHGFGDSADTWLRMLELLGGARRAAIAVDLPGFGQADRLDRDRPVLPQIDSLVAGAVRYATEGGGSAIVAGNSLGGCAAMRAAESPDLPIAGIVPVAPAGLDLARWIAVIQAAPAVRAILRAPIPMPGLVVRRLVGETYRALAFARPRAVDARTVATFASHAPSRRDVIRILATGSRIYPEITDPFRLERIACPTMVVWGERDRMVMPSGGETVRAAVQGSRLETIPGCGHCPQIEAPERLVELILAFVEEVESGSALAGRPAPAT